MKNEVLDQNSSGNHPRGSWPQEINDQNEDRRQYQESHDPMLTPDQAKVLIAGISIDSVSSTPLPTFKTIVGFTNQSYELQRGAWEGWCEGKMFVSTDLSTLTWERRTVALAALNMSIADITSVALDNPGDIKQRRLQLNFGSESIHFQFSHSVQHDEFFSALQQLVRPTQDRGEGRRGHLSSTSPYPLQYHTIMHPLRVMTTNTVHQVTTKRTLLQFLRSVPSLLNRRAKSTSSNGNSSAGSLLRR